VVALGLEPGDEIIAVSNIFLHGTKPGEIKPKFISIY
jgi:hypothetical protein